MFRKMLTSVGFCDIRDTDQSRNILQPIGKRVGVKLSVWLRPLKSSWYKRTYTFSDNVFEQVTYVSGILTKTRYSSQAVKLVLISTLILNLHLPHLTSVVEKKKNLTPPKFPN